MTREESITILKAFMENPLFSEVHKAAFNIAIHDIKQRHDWDINNLILINKDNYEALEQEPTTKNDLGVDLPDINVGKIDNLGVDYLGLVTPQEPRCKDCKWWKDSDGEYRRGCGAESQCPINRKEVYEGNGYCFLYEPQESEDK